MKKILLFLLLICSPALAEEKVRVYTDYTPVRILYLTPGANADVEANKSGLEGEFKEVGKSSIPQDRSERDFWKFESGQVKVDNTRKKARQDLKEKKAADKASAIEKLKAVGFTDSEIDTLPEIRSK